VDYDSGLRSGCFGIAKMVLVSKSSWKLEILRKIYTVLKFSLPHSLINLATAGFMFKITVNQVLNITG